MGKTNKIYDEKTDIEDISSTLLDPDLTKISSGPVFGKRHCQVIILCLLMTIAYAFRVNLSVGIVAMTDPTSSINPDIPTYNWTDKSVVLSSFLWGYILPQVGAGWVAHNYGPKWFLVGAMGVCSIGGFLTPPVASLLGSKGVMAMRALQGVSQGFILPSIQHLLAKWVPRNERSRFSNYVYSGTPVGTVASMLLSGLIASSWYGWPMIFYSFSGSGFLWCLLFAYFGCNSPAEHSTITKEELHYIETSLNVNATKITKKVSTPWVKIFTSLPMWALCIAQAGSVFGFWMLLTQIPNYMNNVMQFDIKSNSLLSSIPYIVSLPLGFLFASLSDFLISRRILSTGVARKLFNSIGGFAPSVALICLGNTSSGESTKGVVLLILAVGLTAATNCSYMINHMDISPTHAGTLMGICNAIANGAGMLAPLSVQFWISDESGNFHSCSTRFGVVTHPVGMTLMGICNAIANGAGMLAPLSVQFWITDESGNFHSCSTRFGVVTHPVGITLMGICNAIANGAGMLAPLSVQFWISNERDPEQWKVIFYATAIINVTSCVVFIIFGSGEIQHWNDEEVADEADLVLKRKLSGII